jgi:predicted CXXCH cytochrome family protein
VSRLPSQVAGLVCGLLMALATSAHAAPASQKPPAGPGGECFTCHAGAYQDKAVVHPPVRNGLCGACHVSTSDSQHTFRLTADGGQMCRQCHAPRDTQKVLHPPVSEGLCLGCHDPHASNNPVRLRKPIYETCTQCHPSKAMQNSRSATRHGALDPERNPKVCVACHDPHQGEHPKRLKDWPPQNVCFGCHDKVLQTQEGTPDLMDMKGWVEQNPETWMKHGPVREGMCPQCHEPHGTDNWRMLRGSFPDEFYAPYVDGETYGICFGCHDRRLVEQSPLAEKPVTNEDWKLDLSWAERPEGKRLVRGGTTGFRNADENLHVRHVNKIDKGRTCRACHDFHASPNPKHIKTMTKFGGWEFKLNYEKTTTGGSCAPGCHVRRYYDRNQRKENPR